MRLPLLWLAAAAAVGASCGGRVVVDVTPTGSGGAGSGGGDAGVSCGTDGLPVPAAFKACALDSCTLGYRYLDCCGSQAAYGIAVTQLTAFDAFEKACDPVMPACQCKGQPTTAEDGKSQAQGTIAAQCVAGVCSSYVP